MKKYAVLFVINALILCALSASALLRIAESCSAIGQCTDAIGPVTWGMALLPLMVILGVGIVVLPKLSRALKAERAARKAAATAVAGVQPPESAVEDAMASRLRRVSKPSSARMADEDGAGWNAADDADDGAAAMAADPLAPVETVEADDPTSAAAQDENDLALAGSVADCADAPGEAGFDADDRAYADLSLPVEDAAELTDDAPVADVSAPVAPSLDGDALPAPELLLAVDNDLAAGDAAAQGEDIWRWLIDDSRIAQLRPAAETGFPWVAAVVDEIATAINDLSDASELGSFAAEVTAWQAVVSELHSTQSITGQDAQSFVGWVNDLLVHCHLVGSGVSAETLLAMAIDRLDARCADDEELAAVLDEIFGLGEEDEERHTDAA